MMWHSWKFPTRFSCVTQNRKLCRSGGGKETTKVYAGTYFTFIRSRARLNHSWPRVDVRPRSPTESAAFSYVRSNFAEKFPRGSQLCRELLVRRYSSLVVPPWSLLIPRHLPQEKYIPARYLFSADNIPSKTNGSDNYYRINTSFFGVCLVPQSTKHNAKKQTTMEVYCSICVFT